MKRLSNIMARFSAHSDDDALWASQLFACGLGNVTAGLIAIVVNCPDTSKTACATGALQFVVGVIAAAAGVYGKYHGAF